MRHIRIKPHIPGFLIGARFVSPADGPFEIDDHRARDLIAAGLAVACAPVDAENPEAIPTAPVERAEKPPANPQRATLKR